MDPLTQPPEIIAEPPNPSQVPAAGANQPKKRKSKLKSNRQAHQAEVTQDQVAAALAASRARVAADGARVGANARDGIAAVKTRVGASANFVDLTEASPKSSEDALTLPTKTPKSATVVESTSVTPTPLQNCTSTAAPEQIAPIPAPTVTNEGGEPQPKRLKVRTDLNRVSLDPDSVIEGERRTARELREEMKSTAARVSLDSDRYDGGDAPDHVPAVSTKTKASVCSAEANAPAKSSTAATKAKTPLKANAITTQAKHPAPQPKKKKRYFHDQILYTMLTSSKPYTIKSLAKACDTTTEALNHAMLSFLDKQLVLSKEFPSKKGEKKLYWANPLSDVELGEKKSAISKEFSKLLATREEMAEADKKQQDLTQKLRGIGEELRPLLAVPTLKQLDDEISTNEKGLQTLQSEILGIRQRIEEASKPKQSSLVQSYNRKKMSPKPQRDKATLKRNINRYIVEYKKRKRQCMEFVDNLADAMEKSTKDAMKTLDLETDEMEWGVFMDCGTGKIYGSKRGGNKGVLGEEDVKVRIPAKYDV